MVEKYTSIAKLLSVPEVAEILGVSRQSIYTYIYHEGLPSLVIGGVRRIRPESLNKWISQREVSYGQTTRTQ